MTTPQATSAYLLQPLRSEEEARAARRKNCTRCGGTGCVPMTQGAMGVWPSLCPVCNPAREEKERESNG